MFWLQILLMLSAGIPIGAAWWANRNTALVHALFWGLLAWMAWLGSAVVYTSETRYIACSLTACAGVAVLGARRPGAAAWNGVVVGLFAVLLLPLAQASFTGGAIFVNPIARWFLTVLLIVGVGNYFPTRLFAGTLLLLAAGMSDLWDFPKERMLSEWRWPLATVALSPWLAAAGIRFWKSRKSEPANQLWREFRDRFGAVWALRMQDQFNHSAQNAGMALVLGWTGIRSQDDRPLSKNEKAAGLELMVALLQRFGLP
ncbi:MAG TPA: hypothetical protein VKS79_02225 [Gemmataceae bacterium]|nr:hypothetical protein [Gemmataceae bacterium]